MQIVLVQVHLTQRQQTRRDGSIGSFSTEGTQINPQQTHRETQLKPDSDSAFFSGTVSSRQKENQSGVFTASSLYTHSDEIVLRIVFGRFVKTGKGYFWKPVFERGYNKDVRHNDR